jgi:predicted membrane-bound spermidine synthase
MSTDGFWWGGQKRGVWISKQEWTGHVNYIMRNCSRRQRQSRRCLELALLVYAIAVLLLWAAWLFRSLGFVYAASLAGLAWLALQVLAAWFRRKGDRRD